ncbi:MAG: hypothetical protein ACTSQ0_00875 [Candidatus Heimdallarchaeota archaeon]
MRPPKSITFMIILILTNLSILNNFTLLSMEKNLTHANELQNSDWFKSARIAGDDFWEDMTDEEVREKVRDLLQQNVNVLELDIGLIHLYETFFNPEIYIQATEQIVEIAHEEGLAVVEYISGFEIITEGANRKEHSVLTDHPDWLQQDLKGNYAIYGTELGFWVERGDESAWVTPLATEWRDQYLSIVADLAATGVDGIYIDIPYWKMWYSDSNEYTWGSFDAYTVAEFENRYGHPPPQTESDFALNNPVFIEWIQFRTNIVNEFFEEVSNVAKGINPEIKIIAELFLAQGLQGLYSGADPYYLHDFVDAIAHEFSIKGHAKAMNEELWLYSVIKNLIYRALDFDHPSWILDYADEQLDSTVLAAANVFFEGNFWETKGPEMADTVGLDYRKQLYNWIQSNDQYLYDSWEVMEPVAVYFSPQTRDFVYSLNASQEPIINSGGLFDDQIWESYDEYIGGHHSYDLFGFVAMLLQSHIPVKIITSRHLPYLDELDAQVLILPDVAALNTTEMDYIQDFATTKPVISTALSSLYFHNGTQRIDFGLQTFFTTNYDSTTSLVKNGNSTYIRNRIGEEYWRDILYGLENDASTKLSFFIEEILSEQVNYSSPITTNASPYTLLNPYTNTTDLIVKIANFKGTRENNQNPEPVKIFLEINDSRNNQYKTLDEIQLTFGGIVHFNGSSLVLVSELYLDLQDTNWYIWGFSICGGIILIIVSIASFYYYKRKKRN